MPKRRHLTGAIVTKDHLKGVPNTPIQVREETVLTRLALFRLPNPKDGDAVHVELYDEFWLYYSGAWHCTVAPDEAHKDPDRKDLLIKCLAWGP